MKRYLFALSMLIVLAYVSVVGASGEPDPMAKIAYRCTVSGICAYWSKCENLPRRDTMTGTGHGWSQHDALLLAHVDVMDQCMAVNGTLVGNATEICYAIPIPDKTKPPN